MQFDLTNRAGNNSTYTVSRLNREVRSLLEGNFGGVWVEAEVSDVTRARSGHVYFSLTDPGANAGVSAVMWKGVAARYGNRVNRGAAIRCHGRVTLYEPRGSYQLVVDRVEQAGAGLKAEQLAMLKKKFEAEGLFDVEKKRPLPQFPQRVGVVTSRSGAAIRDIVKVAFRRFPVSILLAHATVQGEGAPGEIATALDRVASCDVDVVIVGRGGGSSEDLDAFNAEEVVRAAAACPVPVISAVGHEVDVTLLDLVADKRAATPSEAAEMVVPDGEMIKEDLLGAEGNLKRAFLRGLTLNKGKMLDLEARLRARDPRVNLRRGIEVVAACKSVLAGWPELALSRARSNLANGERPLADWPEKAIERASSRLDVAHDSLVSAPVPIVANARESLFELTARLNAISPLASLKRGYSVVKNTSSDSIIKEASDAPPGTEVSITLSKGHILCDVKESHKS